LSDAADVALPRLLQEIDAVRIGYFVYFLYSVLFLATSSLVVQVLNTSATGSPLLRIAEGAGVLSALGRTIGIVRWLTAMPVLAALYLNPSSSVGLREAVSVNYDTLNAFGGGIGELLGVTTFAAIWVILVSIVILQEGTLPRWLGVFGLLAAVAMLFNLVELFGVDLGPLISATLILNHLWLLAVGGTLLMSRKQIAH
jgi:hypothetical protein